MAKKPLDVDALKHGDTRKNIPTAEFESVMDPARQDADRKGV